MARSQRHFQWFDNRATSDDLDKAAMGYRQKYTQTFWSPSEMAHWKEQAAWCSSLADRKRREGR